MRAALANAAWLAASLPAHVRFVRALDDAPAAQWRVLRHNLARNAASGYGSAYRFGEIHSYAEYARRVPVVGYEELEPWIGRIARGESAVLTREPVTHLVPTSGTTGARKLIPFTTSLQREFGAALGPWLVDLVRRHPGVALGAAYWSISPLTRSGPPESSVVPIGFEDDRSYLGAAGARVLAAAMAVPSALRHVAGLDDFRYLTLRCLLRARGLRFVSVWHPSFWTLLLDALPQFWGALLSDLGSGRCPRLERLPGNVAAALRFPPQPRLVQGLRRAMPTRPETVWAALRVLSCWADAHAAGAAAQLQSRLPHVFVQPKGLLSTEACVTLPFAGVHPLAVRSHFFEFAGENGAVVPIEGVRAGEIYTMIVTTGGGLYRYRTEDRVEMTGRIGRTPTLRFVGRRACVSDICGEKLSDDWVAGVIRTVCSRLAKAPSFAMLAPEAGGGDAPWHYELFLAGVSDGALAAQLDGALRANPHYALCRDLGQLGPVRVTRVGEEANQIYLATEMARGRRLGDIKPAALSSHPHWSRLFGGQDGAGVGFQAAQPGR